MPANNEVDRVLLPFVHFGDAPGAGEGASRRFVGAWLGSLGVFRLDTEVVEGTTEELVDFGAHVQNEQIVLSDLLDTKHFAHAVSNTRCESAGNLATQGGSRASLTQSPALNSTGG